MLHYLCIGNHRLVIRDTCVPPVGVFCWHILKKTQARTQLSFLLLYLSRPPILWVYPTLTDTYDADATSSITKIDIPICCFSTKSPFLKISFWAPNKYGINTTVLLLILSPYFFHLYIFTCLNLPPSYSVPFYLAQVTFNIIFVNNLGNIVYAISTLKC